MVLILEMTTIQKVIKYNRLVLVSCPNIIWYVIAILKHTLVDSEDSCSLKLFVAEGQLVFLTSPSLSFSDSTEEILPLAIINGCKVGSKFSSKTFEDRTFRTMSHMFFWWASESHSGTSLCQILTVSEKNHLIKQSFSELTYFRQYSYKITMHQMKTHKHIEHERICYR